MDESPDFETCNIAKIQTGQYLNLQSLPYLPTLLKLISSQTEPGILFAMNMTVYLVYLGGWQWCYAKVQFVRH